MTAVLPTPGSPTSMGEFARSRVTEDFDDLLDLFFSADGGWNLIGAS